MEGLQDCVFSSFLLWISLQMLEKLLT